MQIIQSYITNIFAFFPPKPSAQSIARHCDIDPVKGNWHKFDVYHGQNDAVQSCVVKNICINFWLIYVFDRKICNENLWCVQKFTFLQTIGILFMLI